MLQEHIRQSRENRLDELGRKQTPCSITASRTEIRDRNSKSPSLEVIPSKELLPVTTLIAQEYTKDLVIEMGYNAKDMNDIHQSNNVSNATQERLQESSEEPEMRDSSCQTRESLFETERFSNGPVPFTTFGFRAPSQTSGSFHHHHHHHQSPPSRSHQNSQCSSCSPATRIHDASVAVCPIHTPIPAPPGWATHESSYSSSNKEGQLNEINEYNTYQRFQSPKPTMRDINSSSHNRSSPKFTRQNTLGSGERYGSSLYGSGHGSSGNTTSTQHSGTPGVPGDPRYRAEAVIEVDQKRPFSIESTKSAPDVIATH